MVKAYSWSLNSEYSSSPTFTGDPPYCNPSVSTFEVTQHPVVLSHSRCISQYIHHSPQRNPGLTCGIRTLSPTLTLQLTLFPSLSSPPGPTANTLASFNSLTLDSGRKIPDAVLVSALMRWIRTRSRRGARDLMDLSAVVYRLQSVMFGAILEEDCATIA